MHSIFFNFAADVKWPYILSLKVLFFILGSIICIYSSLTMLQSVFSVLDVWCSFSLIIEYKYFRSCPFSTKISTRKFNSSSRYFSEHNFFALDTNPWKMPLTNAGLTYECRFIWTFVIAFFRCILNSYFSAPVGERGAIHWRNKKTCAHAINWTPTR